MIMNSLKSLYSRDFPGGAVAGIPPSNTGGLESCMSQVGVCMSQLKSLHAAAKTWRSQMNEYIKIFLKNVLYSITLCLKHY